MAKQFVRDRLQNAQRNIAQDWKKLKEFGFVATAILFLGILVTTSVSIAAFFGALTIVIGTNPPPSATESIGLALLSAALAAVVLLLVKPKRGLADEKPGGNAASRRPQTAEVLGNSFIVAAMAFALFGLLCPFLGAASQGQRFFTQTAFGNFNEVLVKWVALISLMLGTVTLVMPLSLGPFLFLSDKLRRKKGQ